MGGWDAARQVHADAPHVAILLVSAAEAELTAFEATDASSCATFACKQDFGPALLREAVSAGRGPGTSGPP